MKLLGVEEVYFPRVVHATRFPSYGEFESFPAYIKLEFIPKSPLKPKSACVGHPAKVRDVWGTRLTLRLWLPAALIAFAEPA